MNKMTVKDLNVSGKRVFVRVDFNVPMDEQGRITDDTRIKASLPTIRDLIGRGAKVILASHLGRPKGGPDPRYSLAPAGKRLGELLGTPVVMAEDCIGPEVKAIVRCPAGRRGPACWRMSASTRKKRRTKRVSPSNWPSWPRFMSTMLLAPRTAPMLPPRAWPNSCTPRRPGF